MMQNLFDLLKDAIIHVSHALHQLSLGLGSDLVRHKCFKRVAVILVSVNGKRLAQALISIDAALARS